MIKIDSDEIFESIVQVTLSGVNTVSGLHVSQWWKVHMYCT